MGIFLGHQLITIFSSVLLEHPGTTQKLPGQRSMQQAMTARILHNMYTYACSASNNDRMNLESIIQNDDVRRLGKRYSCSCSYNLHLNNACASAFLHKFPNETKREINQTDGFLRRKIPRFYFFE